MFNQSRPHVINREQAPEMSNSLKAPANMQISKMIANYQREQAALAARNSHQVKPTSVRIRIPGIFQGQVNRNMVYNRDIIHADQTFANELVQDMEFDSNHSRGVEPRIQICYVLPNARNQRMIQRTQNEAFPSLNRPLQQQHQDMKQANGNFEWPKVQSNIKDGSVKESKTYPVGKGPLLNSSHIRQQTQLKVHQIELGQFKTTSPLTRDQQIQYRMGQPQQNDPKVQNRIFVQQPQVNHIVPNTNLQGHSPIIQEQYTSRRNNTSKHQQQQSIHKKSQRNSKSPNKIELEKNSKKYKNQNKKRQEQISMERNLSKQQIQKNTPTSPKRSDSRNRVQSRIHMKNTIQPKSSAEQLPQPMDRKIKSDPGLNINNINQIQNQEEQQSPYQYNGMFKKQNNQIQYGIIEREQHNGGITRQRRSTSKRHIQTHYYQPNQSINQPMDSILERQILDRAKRTRDQAPAANHSFRPRRIDSSPQRTSQASSSQRQRVTPSRRSHIQLSRSNSIINDDITHIRQRLGEIQRQTNFGRTYRQRTQNDFYFQEESSRQRKMRPSLSINFIDNTANRQMNNRRSTDNLRLINIHEDSEQEEQYGVRRIEFPQQIQFIEVPHLLDSQKTLGAKAEEALLAFDIEIKRHENEPINIIKQQDCVQYYLPWKKLMIYWEYNGRFYLGDGQYLTKWERFIKQGKGIEIMFGQYVYEGTFRDNLKNGYGTANYDSGERYQGDWKNDRFHGQGKLISNGDRYDGNFSKGIKEGFGKQFIQNGDMYVGEYKRDKFHGIGRYIWRNQSQYAGYFRMGYMDGIGEWNSSNGDSYKGQYSKNLKHGQGIYRCYNGRIYKGTFIHGELADSVSHQARNTLPMERQISSQLIIDDDQRSNCSRITFGQRRRHSPDFILNNFYTGCNQRTGLRGHIRNGQLQ